MNIHFEKHKCRRGYRYTFYYRDGFYNPSSFSVVCGKEAKETYIKFWKREKSEIISFSKWNDAVRKLPYFKIQVISFCIFDRWIYFKNDLGYIMGYKIKGNKRIPSQPKYIREFYKNSINTYISPDLLKLKFKKNFII